MNLDDRRYRGTSSRRRRKDGATRRGSRPGLEALEGRTLLASRLFALPVTDTSSIVELNPSTGAEMNQFAAPVPAASDGENGLAFDGQVLYYLPYDGTGRLWELNPDTGAVLKSAVITAGSGHFDGLGAVDGKVYLQDDVNHDLVIVDPSSETVIGQLSVQASLIGGLTGADDPSELVGTESFNTAVFIDPDTGTVLGRSPLPGQIEGVAFVDGDLYFGSSQSDQIYVTDRSGNLLETLNTPFPVSGLGGDGEAPTPTPIPTPTEQVVNGGFEDGSLQGWTAYDEPGSYGPGFQVYQGADPFGSPLPAPPQGTLAAANDQTGPGTDILYQDVTIPAGSAAHLSMLLAYANQAAGFIAPGTLDFQAGPDQQVRVDIMDPGADLLSTGPNDVLLSVFQTQAGSPNTLAPTELDADLSAFAGRTVRLRIAVVDNQNYLNASVDAVSIQTQPTPTPTPTEQVVNGGFELGTLQGWTAYQEAGSDGPGFQVYQGADPFNSPLPAPPQGASAAGDTQDGPGTDVLYQDVTIPAGSAAHLSMLLAYADEAAGFITPGTLDYRAGLDQQLRVDVMDPAADPLSTDPDDVLLNVFQTQAGSPSTMDPTELDADLSAFAGRTVRLRIAVADNQGHLYAAVDAVSVQTQPASPTPTPTPTPSSYYVADPASPGGAAGEILRVDPTTGAQTVVSSGGQFVDPYSVAVAPDGSLVVADPGPYGGTGTIFRVDPTTGAQSVITTGGYLVDPGVVTFAPDGALLVADFGGGSDARIIRVDPNTGQQTIVSEGGYLTGPFGMATAPDGTIYVADYGPPTTAASSGLVFRVDPTTGQQTIVSAGGQLVTPVGILVAPDGSLIVSDDHAIDQRGAIFRVDPQTGAQTVISQDGSFEQPIGLAFAPDGSLLVADAHATGGEGALIRVDLTTGSQTIISSGGDFLNPTGVAVSTVSPPAVTPPTADAGGPYTVEEGGTVTLDASGTTDPSQDPSTLTYLWDLNGDGIFGETGSAATNGDEVGLHPTFSAAGLPGSTWTVALEVIDAQGNVSATKALIYIENLPPSVDLAPTATVDAGGTFSIQGSFSDPGSGETYTGGVDYGDGAGDQWLPLNPDHTFDLGHVYDKAGTYTVTVYVGDDHDGLGRATLEVTVNPIAPAFDSLAGASITYGQATVTLGGHIGGAATVPSGSVAISLDGVTQMAAIDPTTGDFSSDFSTATLGVQGSPYAVTYRYSGDGTYTPISDATRAVTVSPRALTITAVGAAKAYGDADPTFSASYDGLAGGEGPGVLAGSLTFTTSEPAGNAPVGTYTVTPGGLSSPDYAMTFVPGSLSITPRALTITAVDGTKTYGQADPTFGATGAGFAPGEGFNSLGGTLRFATSEPNPLTAPAGSYAITPSGLSSTNYAITYVPGALTVNRAVTTLTASTLPPVVIVGTPLVLSWGKVGSNSVLPVGQTVTVAIVGAGGTLASGSGTIGKDGYFSAFVGTSSLPVGSYTIRYAYAGDTDFTASNATGTLTVTYAVIPHYDSTIPEHAGGAAPIQIAVDDAMGNDLASPGLVVTAVQIVDANGRTFAPVAKRNSNPGNVFRDTGSSYTYNLDTSGLAPGTYTLLVTVGNDPVEHKLTFIVS